MGGMAESELTLAGAGRNVTSLSGVHFLPASSSAGPTLPPLPPIEWQMEHLFWAYSALPWATAASSPCALTWQSAQAIGDRTIVAARSGAGRRRAAAALGNQTLRHSGMLTSASPFSHPLPGLWRDPPQHQPE